MKRAFTRVLVLGLVLAVSACGGGGDDDDGFSQGLIGLCETCGDDADCEEGLSCQTCVECAPEAKRCVGFANEAGLTVPCQEGSYPGGCINIAGPWTLTEGVNGQCEIEGDTIPIEEEGTATVTFVQNGCNVEYIVPNTNAARAGVIVGNRMQLTGPFLLALGGADVDFNGNIATVEGTVTGNTMSLIGTGSGHGTIEGVGFRCEGTSTAFGSR